MVASTPRRTIITALLALVSMAGQGQVKSGLDLCLRDEATGEWLIGLFDEYAIYDCEYWEYADIRKDKLVLTCGERRMDVQLKRKGQAVKNVSIDGVKHRTSVLTSKSLPDYPSKDETAFNEQIADSIANATIRICTRSGNAGMEISCQYHTAFAEDEENEPREYRTDSLGRMEIQIPLFIQTVIELYCDLPSFPKLVDLYFALSPKQTALLYIDDVDGRFYVMGDGARFTNETFIHRLIMDTPYDKEWHALETDECGAHKIGFDNYVAFTERRTGYLHTRLDSIIATYPCLSKRWRDYHRDAIRYNQALDVLCDYSNNLSSSLVRPFMDVAESHHWFQPAVPVTCSSFALPVFMRVCGMMPILERYASPSDDVLRQRLVAMDSVAFSPVNKELYAAGRVFEYIDALSKPLSVEQMNYLPQYIHSPFLLNRIQQKNLEYIAYVEAAKTSLAVKPLDGTAASLRVAETELEGLTDGREIFERIIAPFRGRIVYVDVWGTWCGPCKRQMEYVPAMKEALAGKDIVYLYFCNHSSEEAWLVNREHYHLNTDNSVHYNLPEAQEKALEDFLGVNGYPSYRLFDHSGRIVPPGYAPQPSELDELKECIERISRLNNAE